MSLITSLVNPKQKMATNIFFYAIWTWVFTGFLNSRHGTNWAFSSIQNFHFRKKTDSRSKCWHVLVIPGGFCLKLYKLRHGVPPPLPPGPPPWRLRDVRAPPPPWRSKWIFSLRCWLDLINLTVHGSNLSKSGYFFPTIRLITKYLIHFFYYYVTIMFFKEKLEFRQA